MEDVADIVAQAPLRQMPCRRGGLIRVAMTNCGRLGWVSDRTGHRYDPCDPLSGRSWPEMPDRFTALAASAAVAAGFAPLSPDACLVNRYEAGIGLSLHQDRDELDWSAPIVSVSLGLSAMFLFGGLKRSDPVRRTPLRHGDVVVWGGATRLAFHGVAPLRDGEHRMTGRCRINLTFRSMQGAEQRG